MAYFDKYGVEFSDDRKTLVRFPTDFQGEYIVPYNVECILGSDIGYCAFNNCNALSSITIPKGAKAIGPHAFYKCENLTSVFVQSDFKRDLYHRPFAVFFGEQVENYHLGADITDLGKESFWNCERLIHIEVDPENQEYCSKDGVLFNKSCTKLIRYPSSKNQTSYDIPESVVEIEDGAFAWCKKLIHISIPKQILTIGAETFIGCSALTSIDLPKGLISIGLEAFKYCSALTSIKLPDSVKSIGYGIFEKCSNLISIEIPDGITSIDCGTFSGCKRLEHIKLSKNLTYIAGNDYDGVCQTVNSSFQFCLSLKEIDIPDGVKKIEQRTFTGCKSLSLVKLPDSISYVEKHAFEDCDKISEIYVPLGQEERFCQMEGLKDFSDIILRTSERRRQCEAEEQRLIEIQQQQELLYGSTLFFDTETTSILLGFNSKRSIKEYHNWPRLVQLAWIMTDKEGKVLKRQSHIIIPENFYIEDDAIRVHHITTERARQEGQLLRVVLDEFLSDLELAERIVCHNLDFDKGVVGAELYRHDMAYDMFMNKPAICTMKSSTDYCAIPKRNSDGYKWPSLQELYQKLFGRAFDDAHDALADTTATKECFFELKKRGIIK